MGRSPCCSKVGMNRGAWTAMEDKILTSYIKVHGEGKWRNLPKRAGLKRCGKSCRLRWLNYLRPDIKRGNITRDEEELIIRLHKLLGNRWSLIAGRLPGRTDNEIKNYWNTTLRKKVKDLSSQNATHLSSPPTQPHSILSHSTSPTKAHIIRTKATRCTKALVPLMHPSPPHQHCSPLIDSLQLDPDLQNFSMYHLQDPDINNANHDSDPQQLQEICSYETELLHAINNNDEDAKLPSWVAPHNFLPSHHPALERWTSDSAQDNINDAMDLDPLAFLLDSEEWL